MQKIILSLIYLTACGFNSFAETKLEGKLEPFLGKPELEIQPVFKGERFGNIVVTMDGTVLASWGTSHVRAKRSEDGGKTWGPEIVIAKPGFQPGGLTVNESNGDIFVFIEERHPPAPITVYKSQDDGKTWNKVDVKIKPDSNGNDPSMHMNEHGITLRHGKFKGRMIRPTRWYAGKNDRSLWPKHYTNAIYSDDGGKTWETSDPFPAKGTGEAALVELSDGTLYYNSRRHFSTDGLNPRMRHIATSEDGGHSWGDLYVSKELPDGEQNGNYGLMAGLIRLPFAGYDLLIFSNIESLNGRKNGTVWLSFDGGKSWPVKKSVEPKGFKYSSLAVGRKNTPSEGYISLLYESGTKSDINAYGGGKIAKFNLSWLTEGKNINQYLKK